MTHEPQDTERRKDHKLRARVTEFLDDVRSLHGELPVMGNEGVEAAHRRFLKYADMIWERLPSKESESSSTLYTYQEEIDGEHVAFEIVIPEQTADTPEVDKTAALGPILVAKVVSGASVAWETELPWVVSAGAPIEQQVATARLREMYRWERSFKEKRNLESAG